VVRFREKKVAKKIAVAKTLVSELPTLGHNSWKLLKIIDGRTRTA